MSGRIFSISSGVKRRYSPFRERTVEPQAADAQAFELQYAHLPRAEHAFYLVVLSFKHFDLHTPAAEIDELRGKTLRTVTQHDPSRKAAKSASHGVPSTTAS